MQSLRVQTHELITYPGDPGVRLHLCSGQTTACIDNEKLQHEVLGWSHQGYNINMAQRR